MHNAEMATATLWLVAKARSRNPTLRAFGTRLRELRGPRSRQQIANRLKDLDTPLGGATLAQYEAGTVWAPDPGVLRALAKIYEVDLEGLIDVLRENRLKADATDWRTLTDQPRARDYESVTLPVRIAAALRDPVIVGAVEALVRVDADFRLASTQSLRLIAKLPPVPQPRVPTSERSRAANTKSAPKRRP